MNCPYCELGLKDDNGTGYFRYRCGTEINKAINTKIFRSQGCYERQISNLEAELNRDDNHEDMSRQEIIDAWELAEVQTSHMEDVIKQLKAENERLEENRKSTLVIVSDNYAELATLRTELTKLRTENAELLKDKERLDWIIWHKAELVDYFEDDTGYEEFGLAWHDYKIFNYKNEPNAMEYMDKEKYFENPYEEVREAIDKAKEE